MKKRRCAMGALLLLLACSTVPQENTGTSAAKLGTLTNVENGSGGTDINLSGADDTFAPYKFSNPWFGTLRARGGIAFNNVLLFGTAGVAYGNLRAETAGLTESNTGIGWTAGLGIEVGFTPNWSAKAEWLYLDISEHAYSLTGVSNGLQANLLRFGVNYHF